MKTSYKIKVTFTDNSIKRLQRTAKKIQNEKNINNYILNRFKNVKRIEVFCFNKNTKKFYKNLTFDNQFETWLKSHARIEATNKPGYEDLTGYGALTNGHKNRFYLGRSTGWIPIYLEILKSNSYGGSALFLYGRTFNVVY